MSSQCASTSKTRMASSTACGGSTRVAALLIGRPVSIQARRHADAILHAIVRPLRAHVFVVTDFSETADENSLARVLPEVLGAFLRVYATYGHKQTIPHSLTNATGVVAVKLQLRSVPAGALSCSPGGGCTWQCRGFQPPSWPQPHPAVALSCSDVQWLRLRDAWSILVEVEQKDGTRFDAVVKLRSDTVPLPSWDGARACRLAQSNWSSVYALTDHVLFGSREAMQVLAGLYEARFTHWHGGLWAKSVPPFSLAHYVESVRATPPAAFERGCFRFQQKIVELALPTHPGIAAPLNKSYSGCEVRGRVIEILETALRQWDYVDLFRRDGPSDLSWPPQAKVRAPGQFYTETAMLQWILASNMSVKDLSLATGTTQYLFKGELINRPAMGNATAAASSCTRAQVGRWACVASNLTGYRPDVLFQQAFQRRPFVASRHA